LIAIALVALTFSVLSVVVVPAAQAAEVGYRGPSFKSSSTPSAPTAEKPQSKLWFNDGAWWGALFNGSSRQFEIYRHNASTNKWNTTGVAIDARPTVRLDCLWDGSNLYVASAVRLGAGGTDSSIRIMRYSYSGGTYSMDTGFPVTIANAKVEAVVIDKDTTGTVWATYTHLGSNGAMSVYVAHSTVDARTWVAPYVLPVSGANNLVGGLDGDMSAIVAYRGNIGVMWSNQNDDTMYFATHQDGTADNIWSVTVAVRAPRYADDHMNIKALQVGPEGQVFAATKTSLTASSAPLTLLLVLDSSGNWKRHTFGTVADDHTRPILMIDSENRQLYMFAPSPCCSGGVVYYKQTSLDNISFPTGKGTPFIQSNSDLKINNPTSTKQEINGTTGLMVMAADDDSDYYLYNYLPLNSTGADTTPPDTAITATPTGTESTATFSFTSNEGGSTFECRLDGAAAWEPRCISPKVYENLAEGAHTFEVRATDSAGNTDQTPASHTWTVATTVPPTASTLTFAASGDAHVAMGSANTNYGAVTSLEIDTSPLYEAYLKFDVSGVSGTVTSARVRINVCCSASVNGPEIYGTSSSWDESTLTWNNRPGAIGTAPVDDKAAIATGTWVEYNVTPLVGGNGTQSFVLVADSSDGADLSSREGSFPPELVIEFSGDGSDSTAPETVIDAMPANPSNSSSATFAFTSNEAGSTFTCSLDNAVFAPCSSPVTYEQLANGDHSFQVQATDGAGNADLTPASHAWTIDTNIAALTFTAEADAYVAQGRPDTNYGTMTSTRVDSSPREDAYMRFTISGVAGTVSSATLRVFSSNGTYNLPSVHATSNTWDESTITWNNRPLAGNLIIDSDDAVGNGIWVELDVTAHIGGNGTYSFVLLPESSDGMVLSSRESAEAPQLGIEFAGDGTDSTAPETFIDAKPGELSNSSSATFAFTSNEAGSSFACSLDNAAFAPCSSPVTYEQLADGDHSFQVQATDGVGNVDLTPASHAWTIDTNISSLTFTAEADAYVAQGKPDTNYGTATATRVDSSPREEAYMRFTVSGVAGTVSSATLRVFSTNGTYNLPLVHATSNAWDETSITWNNRPVLENVISDSDETVGVGVWIELDVTAQISGDGTYSFVLVPESSDGLFMSSRETAEAPQLVIETS